MRERTVRTKRPLRSHPVLSSAGGQTPRQSKQTVDVIGAGLAVLFLPALSFVLAAYAWFEIASGDPAPTGNEASSLVE